MHSINRINHFSYAVLLGRFQHEMIGRGLETEESALLGKFGTVAFGSNTRAHKTQELLACADLSVGGKQLSLSFIDFLALSIYLLCIYCFIYVFRCVLLVHPVVRVDFFLYSSFKQHHSVAYRAWLYRVSVSGNWSHRIQFRISWRPSLCIA